MKHCRTCGADSYFKNYCSYCLQAFLDRRKEAYALTTAELGELSSINFDLFQRRFKQIEGKLRKEVKKGRSGQ